MRECVFLYVYMSFLGVSEISGERFLVDKSELSFCVSWRWDEMEKSQQHLSS